MTRPRLTLGWSLGLATAAIVVAVMGTVTYVQQALEVRRDRADRDALLDEVLVPLVSNLEAAESNTQFKEQLAVFQQSCQERGHPFLQLELKDATGRRLASTESRWRIPGAPATLHDTVPVFSPLIDGGTGTLSIWQDDSGFEALQRQRWRFWLLDMATMVACIFAALWIANHFLVTRPLRKLLEGVRQLGQGYPGALKDIPGPREWRWLANNIREMGADLDTTARRLVEAERRAVLACLPAPASPEAERTPEAPACLSVPTPARKTLKQELLRHYFLDKCRLLESQDPNDPEVRRHALEAWERDVAEAERQNEMSLRSRLDNAAFRVLFPAEAQRLGRQVAELIETRQSWFSGIEHRIRKLLQDRAVPIKSLQRRVKHLAGIWRKMQAGGLTLKQIQDIFALRVIVGEEQHCYQALEAVHQHFQVEPLRFRDYIRSPKPNGYQSIHTCVRNGQGWGFEIQIRSVDMHRQADDGAAAHWRYTADQQGEFLAQREKPGLLGRLRARLGR